MKQTWIPGIGIFLLILASCTLNATQEQTFNKEMSRYMEAVNTGATLRAVSMTHPEYVRYVKSQGPDFFKATFGASQPKEARLGSSIIQKTAKKGKHIQILFQVEVDKSPEENTKKLFVGISDDDGVNWFFLPYAAYKDHKMLPKLSRLL